MPLDVARRLLAPLLEGPLSSRYPGSPVRLEPASRGFPTVDPARCERIGACVTACPTGAIELSADGWTFDAGRCLVCQACAVACPRSAIGMVLPIELATRQREELRHVVPLEPPP